MEQIEWPFKNISQIITACLRSLQWLLISLRLKAGVLTVAAEALESALPLPEFTSSLSTSLPLPDSHAFSSNHADFLKEMLSTLLPWGLCPCSSLSGMLSMRRHCIHNGQLYSKCFADGCISSTCPSFRSLLNLLLSRKAFSDYAKKQPPPHLSPTSPYCFYYVSALSSYDYQ